MPVSATTHPTLLDYTKRQDPDKSIATIVETLSQTNEVLEDMVQLEGNLETGHRTTIRSGLPAPTWRKLYGGVQPSKSETVQVTDTIGKWTSSLLTSTATRLRSACRKTWPTLRA
jgi:hypothetical protein